MGLSILGQHIVVKWWFHQFRIIKPFPSSTEGLSGVLGNKGTKGKYGREQGNMTPVLGNTGT